MKVWANETKKLERKRRKGGTIATSGSGDDGYKEGWNEEIREGSVY